MNINGFLHCAAAVVLLASCLGQILGEKSDRNVNDLSASHHPEYQLHHSQENDTGTRQMATDGEALDRQLNGSNHKKPLIGLLLLRKLLGGRNRITKKKQHPPSLRKPRNKRSGQYGRDPYGQAVDYQPLPYPTNPASHMDIFLNENMLVSEWGKCNVSCGIGYQSRFDSGQHNEWRRCLGIDCTNPEALEAKLACSGSAVYMVIGIVIGIIIPFAIGGGAIGVKKFTSTDEKGSSKRRRVSKRPPMPLPRREKTLKGGNDDDQHLYMEIDDHPNNKAKDRNNFVTMTKKNVKKLGRSFKKISKKQEDEGSDHTYVDPDELNQPGSEDLEIHRLRDPPPPPSRKDKQSKKSKKKRAPPENEYEVPMQNDYMEIE